MSGQRRTEQAPGTAAVRQWIADAAADAGAAGIGPIDLCWAGARLAVEAGARSILAGRGEPPSGRLFARPVAGISDAAATALELLARSAPPPLAAVDFAALGALYPALLAGPGRKSTGAWFTPRALTEPTVRRTLEPLLRARMVLRVGDLAVGAGSFLVEALRCLERGSGRPAAAIATGQLFGIDTDPTAVGLAAWTLREACGGSPPPIDALEANLRVGDGLRDDLGGSLDAVVGNPPWETLQSDRHGQVASPHDPRADAARRRALRAGFRHQGRGKLYTYRLFVERALQVLAVGGRLGMLVPASIYYDRDAAPLRELLLQDSRWEWLFGFENRNRLFPIDSRYRFAALIAEKGPATTAVRVAFRRADAAEWAAPAPRHLSYSAAALRRSSPRSGAFVELDDERDWQLLGRLGAGGEPLIGPRGRCRWRQGDFNMTSDAGLFVDRGAAGNLVRAEDGCWRSATGELHLPLYQGAMVFDLHPNAGAYAGGDGRAVQWRGPADADVLEPRYLIPADRFTAGQPARVVHRALTNATNERSAVACLLPAVPCGNSLGVLEPRAPTAAPVRDCAFVAGVFGSLVWDWALRLRLAGTNVNRFVLDDMSLPPATAALVDRIALLTLRLCSILPWHGCLWHSAAAEGWLPGDHGPASHAARDAGTRRRLRAELDIAVATAYGLELADLRWILRDCDHPAANLRRRGFTRSLDAKGFWRIDRCLPPAARQPQLVLQLAAASLPARSGQCTSS